MCMADDSEGYEVYRDAHPVARKPHQCIDCFRTIEPGERYHYGCGLYEGDWDSNHQCLRCEAAALWLTMVCNGWLWGGVREDLAEHWEEDFLYRSHSFGRLVLAAKDKWKLRGRELSADEIKQLVRAALARIPAEGLAA